MTHIPTAQERVLLREQRAKRKRHQEQLEALAQERYDLHAQLAENRAEMRQALRESREVLGVSNLARFTGMTRRAIYNVLDNRSPEVDDTHPGAATHEEVSREQQQRP